VTTFGWAIIGPGRIAHRFAEAVQAWMDRIREQVGVRYPLER
jgi:hypothetical protein